VPHSGAGRPGCGILMALGDGTLFVNDDLRGELRLGPGARRGVSGSRSCSRIRSRSRFAVLELSALGST
jgi:hypothetical protein